MRRPQFATLVLFGVVSAVHFSSSACRAAIYLHYKFDGDTVDAIAGRNGTLIGDATFSSNAAPGIGSTQSLALDGLRDKVIYDTTASDSLNGTFSVALWANAQERRPFGSLAFFGTRGPSDTFGTDLKYLADSFFRVDVGTGTGFLAIHDTPFTWQLNEWHHIAAVITPTQYQLYIDGVLRDTRSFLGVPLVLDSGHDLAVGAVAALLDPHGEDFHGLIDDFRIYDTALTAGEIASIIAAVVPEASAFLTWMLLGSVAAAVSCHLRRRQKPPALVGCSVGR